MWKADDPEDPTISDWAEDGAGLQESEWEKAEEQEQ